MLTSCAPNHVIFLAAINAWAHLIENQMATTKEYGRIYTVITI